MAWWWPHRGLEDLTLTVFPGEVFGYLGPNGAGKTTTIRLMLDFIRPCRGVVRLLGALPRSATGVAARRRIGYLPGELAFDGRDRAADLLRFLAVYLPRMPSGQFRRRARIREGHRRGGHAGGCSVGRVGLGR